MSTYLLQWGLLSFMCGLALSLPLAAVHYQQSAAWTKIFTNPRKLRSAHIDFFMQALTTGFVFVLELALQIDFPTYVTVPFLYGVLLNPTILLIESTSDYRRGVCSIVYKFLKATSPTALLFAWLTIAWIVLPSALLLLFLAIVLSGSIYIHKNIRVKE